MIKSKLSLGDDDLDEKKRRLELKKLATEIAMEDSKAKERLKIKGMIYFNTETGDVRQILEGKPKRLIETLKHVIRDVRHSKLYFEIESHKVKPRFKTWGKAWATNAQQWKIIRLMLPTEKEWDRLCKSLNEESLDGKTGGSGRTGRRDSLTEIVEAKRLAMERFGPDCKRLWERREGVCSKVMSTQEMRYLRERHEAAKSKMMRGKNRRTSFFSCLQDNDKSEEMKVKLQLDRKRRKPRKERSSFSNVSRSSRISISRQSIIDRLGIGNRTLFQCLDPTPFACTHTRLFA
jgi:hypothetical protein